MGKSLGLVYINKISLIFIFAIYDIIFDMLIAYIDKNVNNRSTIRVDDQAKGMAQSSLKLSS